MPCRFSFAIRLKKSIVTTGLLMLSGLVAILLGVRSMAQEIETTSLSVGMTSPTPPGPVSPTAPSRVPVALLRGEDPELDGLEAPGEGGTLVLCDDFYYAESSGLAKYNGHVFVVGSNLRFRCESMIVTYGKAHKVEHVHVTGHVLIEQPGQLAHAGVADFSPTEDKIVLTEKPDVQSGQNKVFAPVITILRGKKALFTEGRTHSVLVGSIAPSHGEASPTPSPTPVKDER